RLRKDIHHLRWGGVGSNVIVAGFTAQEQVTHAAAGKVGPMAAIAQGANDIGGVLFGRSTQHSALSIQHSAFNDRNESSLPAMLFHDVKVTSIPKLIN